MKKTIALLMIAMFWLSACSSRNNDEADQTTVTDGSGLSIGAATDGEFIIPTEDIDVIRVFSDPATVLTGDTANALITALVLDDQNRAIQGFDVSFSSDGGALQNISSITDENGAATAELNLTGDFRNNGITVTATVDGVSDDVLVVALGSTLTMTATEDLVVGQTADLTFTLMSGAGTPIPNEVIQFNSLAGNTFSQNSAITNAQGIATVSMSTTAGADEISATALDGTALLTTPLAIAENLQAVITPVRIRVITNESTIETGGNDIARITTLVTDDNNRVLADKEVFFSSTGGVLQNISGVTNDAGQATAELSLAGDYRNQTITVTARVDDEEGQVLINTEGSKVSIAGPTALVTGDTAELEITLIGGNDQPIPNEPLFISSTANNTIQPGNAVTDANGKVTITVSSEAGTDNIIVAALDSTVAATHALQVAADVLSVEGGAFDDLPVSTFSPFAVRWTSNGFPVAGQMMRFSTTAGVVRGAGNTGAGSSSIDVVTDADGLASVELMSNSAGPATISFADALDSDPTSQFEVNFVAILPSDITMTATPASVATGNTSTISAVVTDVFGNPVRDTIVEFSSADLRGGSLAPVSAITDSDGNASVTFTAGNLPTQIDGISIVATATDFSPAVSPAQVNLTITERQLNVIIGLSGELVEQQSDTRYSRTGVVQVTDGAGRPVPDAAIQLSLRPTIYRYGQLERVDADGNGDADAWALVEAEECVAEDSNRNRILDAGEDMNQNFVLDPADPALVDIDPANQPTLVGGQITTDESGVGFFTIVYPQSNALWSKVEVTARAEALGTEGVVMLETELLMSVADIVNVLANPPNRFSPYGVVSPAAQTGCANLIFFVPDSL